MNKVVLNDVEYDVPEITFEEVCRLEEKGIYLLNMDPNDRRVASLIRGFVAWITGKEPAEASAILQEHLENGGSIDDIVTAVQKAFNESGFFGQGRKVRKTPQDHQKKGSKRNTSASQT